MAWTPEFNLGERVVTIKAVAKMNCQGETELSLGVHVKSGKFLTDDRVAASLGADILLLN